MSTFIVEGPVGYCYCEINDNKKILLFADRHESYKSNFNFNLFNLIENFFFLNKIHNECFDLFIENEISLDSNNKILSEGKLINAVRKKFNNINLNKNFNVRIHNIDIGQINKESQRYQDPVIFGVVIKEISNNASIINFFWENKDNLYKIIFGIYLIMVNETDDKYSQFTELGQQYFENSQKINGISHNNILQNLIKHKLKKQINAIDTQYFTKEQLYGYFEKSAEDVHKESVRYTDITNIQILLKVRFMLIETYTICRMFRTLKKKNNKYCNENILKNIIYFGGAGHVKNIIDFIKQVIKKEPHFYKLNDYDLVSDNNKDFKLKTQFYIEMEKYNYFGYDINKLINYKYFLDKNCNNFNENDKDKFVYYKATLKNGIIQYEENDNNLLSLSDINENQYVIKTCNNIYNMPIIK